MLADQGGADICYSGPGWSGHLAFIEPDAAEFAGDLEEWKRMGPRICTLSPLTIAQNSMHGSFGAGGDLWAVPPKAATIGPAEVIAAKNRFDQHALRIDGSRVSWQRMITRLVLHGPVTPRLPASILQTLRTDVLVSESAARYWSAMGDRILKMSDVIITNVRVLEPGEGIVAQSVQIRGGKIAELDPRDGAPGRRGGCRRWRSAADARIDRRPHAWHRAICLRSGTGTDRRGIETARTVWYDVRAADPVSDGVAGTLRRIRAVGRRDLIGRRCLHARASSRRAVSGGARRWGPDDARRFRTLGRPLGSHRR